MDFNLTDFTFDLSAVDDISSPAPAENSDVLDNFPQSSDFELTVVCSR
jgi:hypothetical protein